MNTAVRLDTFPMPYEHGLVVHPMPAGAELLFFTTQYGKCALVASVDPQQPIVQRQFLVTGVNKQLTVHNATLTFIGAYRRPGSEADFVLFEHLQVAPDIIAPSDLDDDPSWPTEDAASAPRRGDAVRRPESTHHAATPFIERSLPPDP